MDEINIELMEAGTRISIANITSQLSNAALGELLRDAMRQAHSSNGSVVVSWHDRRRR